MLITEYVKDKGIDKYYKSPRYIKFSLLANYIKLVLEGEWIGDIKPIPNDFSTVTQIAQHFVLMPEGSALRLGDVYIIEKPSRYRYGVYISPNLVIEQTSHLEPDHIEQHDDIATEIAFANSKNWNTRILRPVNTKNITPADLIDFQKFILDYFDDIDTGQPNYRAPTYAQRKLFLTALRSITSQAGAPYLDVDVTAAKAILDTFDYKIIKGHDTINLRPFVALYPNSPMNTPYNWGLYRMNIDEGFTTLMTAVHPRTDYHCEIGATIANSFRPGQLLAIATCLRSVTDPFRTAIKTPATTTTGTMTFTFRSVTSSSVPYNATKAQVQAALDAMSSIGKGNSHVVFDALNLTGGLIINLDQELFNSGSPNDTITVNQTGFDVAATVDHNADHARNSNTMIQWVTKEYQDNSRTSNKQIHGFDDDNRGVDIVLSSSRTIPSVVYFETLHILRSNGYSVLARLEGGQQTIVLSKTITGGTFTLGFNNETTAAITYSATPATMASNIKTALEALNSVGVRNVEVAMSYEDTDQRIYLVSFVNDIIENSIEDRMTITPTLTGTSIVAEVHNGSNVVLAALTNTNGYVAQLNTGQFTHIEISETIRNSLPLLRTLMTVIGTTEDEILSGRSTPIVTRNKFIPEQIIKSVSLLQTIGESKYAANADHSHPWSTSDGIAGNNYVATRNDVNTGNLWRTPQQIRSLIGGYHVTDVDALAHQIFTAPLSTVYTVTTARLVHGVRLRVPSFPAAPTYTKARWYVAQAAVGHTGGRLAVYQSGVLLFQETLSGGSSIGSTGFKEVTFTTPFTPATGISLDIFIYAYGGTPTTLPQLGITGNSAAVNAGNTGSSAYFFTSSDSLGATAPSTLPSKTASNEATWLALV